MKNEQFKNMWPHTWYAYKFLGDNQNESKRALRRRMDVKKYNLERITSETNLMKNQYNLSF